jgi:hypothetical protein
MPDRIRVQTGGAQTNQTRAPFTTGDTARPVEAVANRIGHNPFSPTARHFPPLHERHRSESHTRGACPYTNGERRHPPDASAPEHPNAQTP